MSGIYAYTMAMKKILFGVFAHPDDEAFGPAGTLLSEVENGTEVQLISLTLGEAGANPDNVPSLVDVREQEWRKSGELIGATRMHYLGYKDGQLTNESMITAGERLVDIIRQETSQLPDDAEIELMSIDLNGVTGHIDHIVAGRAACWAFYTLKKTDARMKRIRLVCRPRHHVPEVSTDWVFVEPGYLDGEIDEVVDARQHHDRIVEIMRAHHSQRADCDAHLQNESESIGLDCFKVLS